ncbi:MAG: hypothetical protein ABFQ62_05600 [Patescibacteria group bacterium]
MQIFKKKAYQKPKTIDEARLNPLYRGKIVIESPEGLYSTTRGENAVKKYKKLEKKYPLNSLVTTVIPKGLMTTMAHKYSI